MHLFWKKQGHLSHLRPTRRFQTIELQYWQPTSARIETRPRYAYLKWTVFLQDRDLLKLRNDSEPAAGCLSNFYLKELSLLAVEHVAAGMVSCVVLPNH